MHKVTKKQQTLIISLVVLLIAGIAPLLSQQSPEQRSQPSPFTTSSTPAASPTSPSANLQLQILAAEMTSPSGELYTVTKVVDGDTIKVDVAGTVETVRIVGINTPETVDPRKPVECMGKEASYFVKQLLNSVSVRLEKDVTQGNRDRYGRLLRFVFLEDGTDVGKLLISEGYAHESLYSSRPHRYRTAYLEAQQQAQELQKGLWNSSSCPTD